MTRTTSASCGASRSASAGSSRRGTTRCSSRARRCVTGTAWCVVVSSRRGTTRGSSRARRSEEKVRKERGQEKTRSGGGQTEVESEEGRIRRSEGRGRAARPSSSGRNIATSSPPLHQNAAFGVVVNCLVGTDVPTSRDSRSHNRTSSHRTVRRVRLPVGTRVVLAFDRYAVSAR